MKRILPIAGITAGCGLIVAVFIFIRSSAEPPLPAATPAPVLDLAGIKAKAEQNDARAQTQLAKAFAQCAGVPRDYKQAALCYGKAASNGNIEAEATLGELYQAGQGVPHDLTNALNWLTKAAQSGSTAAQYDLGFMYEQGQGVKKDEKLAAHWYRLAAEGGDLNSTRWTETIPAEGRAASVTVSEQVKCVPRSLSHSQPDGHFAGAAVGPGIIGNRLEVRAVDGFDAVQ